MTGPNSIVRIVDGALRGRAVDGVHQFLGIPFAQAPVGPLRWRPPVAVKRWSGVRDCLEYGPINQQPPLPGAFAALSPDPARIGDDCLNLNLWTPDPTASGLPVLVWIHGGAFFAGSGSDEIYDGSAFARDGVVAVTINYRLGAHGYLHLDDLFPDLATAGSLGMQDQIAALRWVHDNISAFGGDPAQVTVAGESAGAMSIATLLASPERKGLFQQAIVQSPPGNITAGPATATRIAGYVLERLGISPGDTAALGAVDPLALQEAEAAIIEEAQTAPTPERFGEIAAAPMPFVPVHDTALLPRRPLDALHDGVAADVRVLTGSNTEESLIFLAGAEDMITDDVLTAALTAAFAGSGRTSDEAAARYRERLPSARPHEILAAAETDRMFRIPTYRLADALARHNPATWVYEFAWRSPFPGYGAGHFIEVPFAFHTIHTQQGLAFVGQDAPAALADTMHEVWVTFAATGEPRTGRLPVWNRWNPDDPRLMVLDLDPRTSGDPRPRESALWVHNSMDGES